MPETIHIEVEQRSIQDIVAARIEAEVAAALIKGGGAEALVTAIVQKALQGKKDYPRRPWVEDALETAIQKSAAGAIRAWIEASQALIAAKVVELLTADEGLITRIATGLVHGITGPRKVEVAIGLAVPVVVEDNGS